jgi:hypothetical protein
MSDVQHAEAHRLLPILYSAARRGKQLNYNSAAAALGRDPGTNYRTVAQMCDLLDAAATLAGTPLLALNVVRGQDKEINHNAWRHVPGSLRKAIISRSQAHQFTQMDIEAIAHALEALKGKGNRAAWKYVEHVFGATFHRRLAGQDPAILVDAINDIGSDMPDRAMASGMRYARNEQVRQLVLGRAKGKCELCGTLGFLLPDGHRYLECHHVIALANEGEDRVSNVVALCPADHREAHYGARAEEIEAELIKNLTYLSRA